MITKKNTDWAYRLCDFIQYESTYEKNIIAAINEPDLLLANDVYRNHTFMDSFLRPYEQKILVHTTSKDNYKSILHDGYIKSWNLLKSEGKINNKQPIGGLLTRDDAHLKVKNKLKLDKYIIWISTPHVLGIQEITTP